MIRTLSIAALALSCAVPTFSQASAAPATPGEYAITNVTVIPMDRQQALPDQTVIVRAGKIAEMGPAASVRVPASATKIDGRGKFLMPGLADMHMRISQGAGAPNDLVTKQMIVLVANGITTARGMFGQPAHPAVRDKIAKGELFGPALYVGSPPLGGSSAAGPDAARISIEQWKKDGYDFMVSWYGISRSTYDRITETARAQNVPVAGKVDTVAGLRRALAAKARTVEHLDGFLEEIATANSPLREVDSQFVPGEILNYLDESKIPAVAAAVRDAGVYSTPTLALTRQWISDLTPDELRKQPDLKYVPPQALTQWTNQRNGQMAGNAPAAARKKHVDIRNKIALGLYQSGAKLLAGSDAPSPFFVHGFGIHREMQAMVDAGIPVYGVLEAATKNAAECMKGDFGVVAAGKRADLLLLEANPLESVANVQKRAGVMLRGEWFPEAELQKKLEWVAGSFPPPAAAPPRQ